MLKFDRERIVAYQDYELSSVIQPFKLVEIKPLSYKYGINRLLRAIRSQSPPKTSALEDIHILRSVLQTRTITTRTLIQKMGMVTPHQVFAYMVSQHLQQRALSEWRPLLRLDLKMNKERDDNASAMNNKTGYRSSTK